MRALALLTAVGLSATSLAWRDYTHAALTVFSLQHVGGGLSVPILDRNLFKTDTIYPLRMNSMMESSTLLYAFMEGSISQDCDFPFSWGLICVNHFYNPLDNSGLSDIAPGFLTQNSMSWAYNGYANSDTWVNARQRYYEALTASTPLQRKAAAQEMFYDLGNVAHLIQDLAQPQHSRNDAHMDESSGGYGIEHFADREFGTLGAVRAIYPASNPPVDAFYPTGSLVVRQIDQSIPEEFQWLWDTEDYIGQENFVSARLPFSTYPRPLLNGLAEVVNFHFVTTDTVFSSANVLRLSDGRKIPHFQSYFFDQGLHFDSQRVFMHPTAEEWGVPGLASQLWPGDIRSSVGQGWALESQPTMEVKSPLTTSNGGYASVSMSWRDSLGGFRKGQFFFRDSDYRNICKAVLPYAIDYTAYMIGMFFRGDIQASSLQRPISDAMHRLTVNNLTENGRYGVLGSGQFLILQTNPSGQRSHRQVVNVEPPGPISYGQSARLSFFPKPWLGEQFIVAFRGAMGTEVDGIAATKMFRVTQDALEAVIDTTTESSQVYANKNGVRYVTYRGEEVSLDSSFNGEATLPVFSDGSVSFQVKNLTMTDKRVQLYGSNRSARGTLRVYLGDRTDNVGATLQSDVVRLTFVGTYIDVVGGECRWESQLGKETKGYVTPICSMTQG